MYTPTLEQKLLTDSHSYSFSHTHTPRENEILTATELQHITSMTI